MIHIQEIRIQHMDAMGSAISARDSRGLPDWRPHDPGKHPVTQRVQTSGSIQETFAINGPRLGDAR